MLYFILFVGICAKNGVVIATDKKLPSSLAEVEEVAKIENITDKAGFVYSGIGPDYRVLVRKARKNAQSYFRTYRETQPVGQLTKYAASVMQEFTQSGGVRPFGVSLLVAGVNAEDEPCLYQVDPSGTYIQWKATAIGRNYIHCKEFLEKRYSDEMELEDAIHTALLTLREGFEGQMNSTNIEVGIISLDEGDKAKFRLLNPSEIQDYLDEAT